MKTTAQETGAATPVEKDRFDKKKVNTRVSPVINFQIGLIATLILTFLIIELTSATVTTKQSSKKAKTHVFEPEQNDPTTYLIVANKPKKVHTAKPEQKIEIVPDNKPEPQPDPEPQPHPEPETKPVDNSDATQPDDTSSVPNKTDQPVKKDNTPITTGMYGLNEMPLFPGCKERYDNEERKECFNDRMQRFVNRNFNTDLANELGLEAGSKIRIQIAFTIDTNGNPMDIKVRAPHPRLEKEAYRVIKKLPTIIPGKVKGESVNMLFSLPILFNIQN